MARKIFGQEIATIALNIAYVFLIISVITCVVSIIKVALSSHNDDVGTLVQSILSIVAYICLILGIQRNQAKFLIPYMALGFIAIVVTIVNIVLSVGLTLSWVILVFNVFFLALVYMLYKDMTEGITVVPEIH